jgi:hypothetical protein
MRPSLIIFAPLLVGITLPGCDAILSHPAIPPQAKLLAHESIEQVKMLRGDVDQFMAGFRFAPHEQAAASQMTQAMFLVLEIRDTGSLVKAAVAVKRAQLCLLSVGVESSGVLEDLRAVLFKDDWARERWLLVEQYLASEEAPKLDGLVCDNAGTLPS